MDSFTRIVGKFDRALSLCARQAFTVQKVKRFRPELIHLF